MGASAELQRVIKITAAQDQDLAFAIDAGAWRYVGVRLWVEGIEGTGSISVKLQHAALNEDSEYLDLISFTSVADTDSFPNVQFNSSDSFLRWLRWSVPSMTATSAKFGIVLTLKN